MFADPKAAIVYSLRASRILFHRYLNDLKPEEFDHQPFPGVNSAAWLVGHLALTDRRQLIGLGVTHLPAVPDGFEARFAATRVGAGEQKGLGDPKELMALFDAHRAKLIEVVGTVDAAKLAEPPAYPSPMFADRGEASLFMGLHTALHLGQVSLIRRSLGYPPVV